MVALEREARIAKRRAMLPEIGGSMDAMVRRWLRDVPTSVLLDEVRRRDVGDARIVTDYQLEREAKARGYLIARPGVSRSLPGFVFDATRRTIEWRGKTAELTQREADVAGLIATAYPHGATTQQIARVLYSSIGGSADNGVRVYVSYLRRKLPGMIMTSRSGIASGRAYYLAIDEEAT